MKKTLILSLLIMSLVMVGCSKGKTPDKGGNPNVEQGGKDKEDEKKPDGETPDEGKGEGEEGDNGKEETPTPDAGTGANVNKEKQEELDKIHEAVVKAYEEYLPNMPYDAAYIKESFGVEEGWYDAFVAEGPMITMHVDTFLAFHPTEGNKESIVTALEKHKEFLVNESFQYPMNMGKVAAATVVEEGDYVYFIMLGTIDNDMTDDDKRIEAFKEQNEIAIEAIKNFGK